MVKWTILIAAYTAGCIWLSMRRMEAHGTGPKTPRGRFREMRWGLALLALAISLIGLNGVNHWPTVIAMLIAGLVLVLLPRQAAWLVAVMLIALGMYGFLLVRAYQRGDPVQKLYGLVLAGAGSYRTEFVLPQAYVFLVLGVWLLWRTVGRHSRLAGLLPGRRPWWCLLLLPVAAVVIELAGPNYGFSPSSWNIVWNLAAAAAVLLIVWSFPAGAADLAAAGLIALGLYGIVLALSWPSAPFVASYGTLRFGAVLVDNATWAAGAGLEGCLMLAFGLWLVPRTLIPHARVLLRPEPGGDLAGRVEQLTRARADAVDSAAAELRRVERDLHDGAQARLVALGMSLRAAEHLIPGSPQAAVALVAEAREASSKALTELRNLVRGIYPPVLADRGLGEAVRALALDTPLRTEADIMLPERLDAPVESACYFAVAEALTNAVKHSGARHAQVRIRHARGMLRVEVTDDGCGGADPARGGGLAGIERRLGTFDGILAVSSPPGGPTMIVMEVPCALSSPRTRSS
jgi:signal transduction histidine kinase